jgi:hypothetical protein
MNPIDKNPVKGVETQDNTHNQDPNLEKIRYYKGTWKNFFDYWNKRGVETDPYKGTELKYPNEKIDNGNAPHQDFGTYDKKKMNKLTESFEQFINESATLKDVKDFSGSKDKILVGLKTNLLKDMLDRYESMSRGEEIYFFNKGKHFGTLFDKGTRFQELRHDGSLDDKGWIKK